MSAIGPKLPLQKDNLYGFYSLTTQYKEQIQQNLKNLLLTSPGERVMLPDFGVGLRHFLFEPRQHSVAKMRQKIDQQIKTQESYAKILKQVKDAEKGSE